MCGATRRRTCSPGGDPIYINLHTHTMPRFFYAAQQQVKQSCLLRIGGRSRILILCINTWFPNSRKSASCNTNSYLKHEQLHHLSACNLGKSNNGLRGFWGILQYQRPITCAKAMYCWLYTFFGASCANQPSNFCEHLLDTRASTPLLSNEQMLCVS